MFLLFFWLLLCFLVSFYASKKGHNAKVLFIVSLFLSPIVGFFITLFREINREALESKCITKSDKNKCSHCADLIQDCAELIKDRYIICKHCGQDVSTLNVKVEFKKQDLEEAVEKNSSNKTKAENKFNFKKFFFKIWILCLFLKFLKWVYSLSLMSSILAADAVRIFSSCIFGSLGHALLLYAIAAISYVITSKILSFMYKIDEELCLSIFRYVCIYGSFHVFLVPVI